MRMNKKNDICAMKVVNEYSLEKLSKVLFEYGDLKNSKKYQIRFLPLDLKKK